MTTIMCFYREISQAFLLSNPALCRMPTWPVIHKNSGCTDREEVVHVIGNIRYIQPLGLEL